MRTLGKIAATLGVIGAFAASSALPASALDVYIGHRHHHDYYDYGGRDCRPGWSLQGGVCKPYHYGPWDMYNHGYERWR